MSDQRLVGKCKAKDVVAVMVVAWLLHAQLLIPGLTSAGISHTRVADQMASHHRYSRIDPSFLHGLCSYWL